MTDYEKRIAAADITLRTSDYFGLNGAQLNVWSLRQELIKTHSFAILTSATIEALKPYGPMLEIGSGAGYWAMELRKAGIDVLATDKEPGCDHYFKGKLWIDDMLQVDAVTAVREYPRRTLLTVWPSYQETWAAQALKVFQGEYVIYVGESAGGCTADESFHEVFATLEEDKEIDIPQWPGIHDYVSIRKNIPVRETYRRVLWKS
jgi:hypothetical protein